MINPVRDFSADERMAVQEYVAQGGRLLVLDDRGNQGSTANQILASFQMQFDLSGEPVRKDSTEVKADSVQIDTGAATVVGGEPILLSRTGHAILSQKEFGRGFVIAFSNSHVFEANVIGPVGTSPTPSQLAIYKVIYDLYDRLSLPE